MLNEKNFWKKVIKTESCWLWSASTKGGYGCFGVDGKTLSSHRISWEIVNGKIPDGMDCLHKCDVPSCVNPSHLFIGTHKDNMDDMSIKGRKFILKGILNGQSKLTDKKVKEIRKFRSEYGTSYRVLGKDFGVSYTTIKRVIKNECWSHVC